MTDSPALFGIIRVKYDKQYLLPLDDALALVALIARAKEVDADYSGKISKISPYKSEITVQVVTQEYVKESMLTNMVE